jgi:hypothetical protein
MQWHVTIKPDQKANRKNQNKSMGLKFASPQIKRTPKKALTIITRFCIFGPRCSRERFCSNGLERGAILILTSRLKASYSADSQQMLRGTILTLGWEIDL